MNKYKYHIIGLIVAILIGIALGTAFTNNQKNSEINKLKEEQKKELLKTIEESKKFQKLAEKRLASKDTLLKEQAKIITGLEQDITKNHKEVQKLRQQVKDMTLDEKRGWLIQRYND